MENKLKFSPGNAKINFIPSLNLSAGFSCPFADKCFTKVDPLTNKIIEGPNSEFRCFSASQENVFPSVRRQREFNFNLLKKIRTVKEMAELIEESLPHRKYNIIRIHVSGDFFSQQYFDSWMLVARRNPDRLFYTYTKSLPYWIARIGQIPANLSLTASWGGKFDSYISKFNLKSALVVGSLQEAFELGLEIDHDDSHAYIAEMPSFALLIHGTQKAGTKFSIAKAQLRKEGITGYHRDKKKIAA